MTSQQALELGSVFGQSLGDERRRRRIERVGRQRRLRQQAPRQPSPCRIRHMGLDVRLIPHGAMDESAPEAVRARTVGRPIEGLSVLDRW